MIKKILVNVILFLSSIFLFLIIITLAGVNFGKQSNINEKVNDSLVLELKNELELMKRENLNLKGNLTAKDLEISQLQNDLFEQGMLFKKEKEELLVSNSLQKEEFNEQLLEIQETLNKTLQSCEIKPKVKKNVKRKKVIKKKIQPNNVIINNIYVNEKKEFPKRVILKERATLFPNDTLK